MHRNLIFASESNAHDPHPNCGLDFQANRLEHAKIAQSCNPALKAVEIHPFTPVLMPSIFNPLSNQKRHVSACDASTLHP
jgi:hypothetical protein